MTLAVNIEKQSGSHKSTESDPNTITANVNPIRVILYPVYFYYIAMEELVLQKVKKSVKLSLLALTICFL